MISGSLRSEARMNCKDNFLTEPQTKPQTHKQKKKAAAATAPLANVYACVIVWMLNITAGVANNAYVLLYAMCWKCKTKQNKNVIYFAGVTRSAERNTKPNTTAQKEVESSPKTQIEILIIKHAQLLRCIAGVRNLVKMIVRSAMNPTRVKAYFCEYFLRKKEKPTIKLFFAAAKIYFQDTFDEVLLCFSF